MWEFCCIFQIYDTIEFNEFLQMMSKQQRFGLTEDSLKEAFRIFDKDDDGFLAVEELRHIMQSLGMVGIREIEKNHLKSMERKHVAVFVLCTFVAQELKYSFNAAGNKFFPS